MSWRVIALWLLCVLMLWSVAHSLNRWVLAIDQSTEARRFAFWTAAKVVAWLWPTWLLLRRVGGASARWLGLTTARGLAEACLWSVLWIALQELGGRLHLPLFGRPPADLAAYSLAGSLVIAPSFEEIMFRGAMLRVLRGAGYARGISVLASATGFALLHVPGWIFRRGFDLSIGGSFFAIWVLGVIVGLLAWRLPTLWGAIVLHWANNFWSSGALAWCVERVIGALHLV